MSNPQLAIKHRQAVFPHPSIMRRRLSRGASDKEQRRGGDTYARVYAEKMADTVPSVLGLFRIRNLMFSMSLASSGRRAHGVMGVVGDMTGGH